MINSSILYLFHLIPYHLPISLKPNKVNRNTAKGTRCFICILSISAYFKMNFSLRICKVEKERAVFEAARAKNDEKLLCVDIFDDRHSLQSFCWFSNCQKRSKQNNSDYEYKWNERNAPCCSPNVCY